MKKLLAVTLLAVCFPLLVGSKHIGPLYDTRTYDALDMLAVEIAKKHRLTFLNSGVKSMVDSKKGVWAISLVSHKHLTIEEGRKLASDISYQLLYQLFHDPLFAKHCEISRRLITEDLIGFRLAFWDQNVDRPLYPYLAQVRLADGKLYFHYADPETQALQEPIVESLNIPNYR